MTVRVLVGDALSVLRTLPAESVQCVITSPPYFGLRAYGTDPQVWGGDPEHGHEFGERVVTRVGGGPQGETGQRATRTFTATGSATSAFCPCGAWRGELGSEPTPALFIEHLVSIFDEVWRVMRLDATLWVNLGDSYSGSGKGPQTSTSTLADGRVARLGDQSSLAKRGAELRQGFVNVKTQDGGIPAKNLLLMPQRFAIAMQERGWIVRSEIVWAKTSAMPESVRDRPTSAWEPIWMFSKSARYFYDGDSVRQPVTGGAHSRGPNGAAVVNPKAVEMGLGIKQNVSFQAAMAKLPDSAGAALRNVWTLGPSPFADAHFATFPPEIPRRAILAGTSEKGACPACGAGWVRESTSRIEYTQRTHNHPKYGDDGQFGHMAANRHRDGHIPGRKITETTGWQPSCSCDAGPPVAQTVLDPFLGSGTTAMVADRLGRDAIGIELSKEYAEMARKRIEQDAGPLFGDPVAVEVPQQVDLFGEASG